MDLFESFRRAMVELAQEDYYQVLFDDGFRVLDHLHARYQQIDATLFNLRQYLGLQRQLALDGIWPEMYEGLLEQLEDQRREMARRIAAQHEHIMGVFGEYAENLQRQ